MKIGRKLLIGALLSVILCCFSRATGNAEIIDYKKHNGFVYYVEEAWDDAGNMFASVVITNYKGKATKLTIPTKIKGIEVEYIESLGKSKTVKELHIPNGLNVDGSKLSSLPNLKKVTVSKDNPDYIVKNKLLLSRDGHFLAGCPGGLEYPKIPDSVTVIESSAFAHSSVKKITIGKNITDIGGGCFYDCRNLSEVNFHKEIELKRLEDIFSDCKSLKTIELPESVTEIYGDVFSGCISLESVSIGKNVTYIDDCMFTDCPKLRSVYFYNTKCDFGNEYSLIDFYGKWLFNEYSKCMDTVTIYGQKDSDAIKEAKKAGIKYKVIDGNSAVRQYKDFEYMVSSGKNGKTITIVNYTGKETSVAIPKTMNGIPVGALRSLGASSYVKQVHIPNGIQVKGSALASCQKLEKIRISKTNADYTVKNKLLLSKDKKTLVACPGSLKEPKIPSSVRSIGEGAFSGSVVKKVLIGKNVENMSYEVFKNCKKLTSVKFHKDTKVRIIKNFMFENCKSLKKVEFPESIRQIWDGVFYDCASLDTVIMGKKLDYIGYNMFKNCKKLRSVYIYSKDCIFGRGHQDIVFSLYKQNRVTFYGKEGSTLQDITSGYMMAKFKVLKEK